MQLLEDHPRVCGEHLQSWKQRRKQTGSSPRVRGAPTAPGSATARSGIIPACAGSTTTTTSSRTGTWDHPRVCGEHGSPHLG